MKILYFTRDFSPENVAFAKQHGLIMRNAAAVETSANVEPCDAVYGDEVPDTYRAAFPTYTLPEKIDEAEIITLREKITQLEAKLAGKSSKSSKTTKKDEGLTAA